jgi:YVTN family beta-propeller protein
VYDSGEGEHLTFTDGQWTAPPVSEDRGSRGRWRRIRLLLLVGVVLAVVVVLIVTAPAPTVLTVGVVDSETGAPLSGAEVVAHIPGENALPAATTGDDGIVHFELDDGQEGYRVQVQKVDYDLMSVDGVVVADQQETVLPVSLTRNPGGRLFVGLEGARVVQVDTASLVRMQTIVLPIAPEAPVRHLRLHPTQDLLYVVAGAEGQILSALTGATLAEFGVQAASIDSLEVSADGRYVLATGTAGIDTAGIIEQRRLWFLEAQSGALVTDTVLSQANSRVEVEWQPDGMDVYVLLATRSVIDRAIASSATFGGIDRVALRATGSSNRVNLSASGEYLYTWEGMFYSVERGGFYDSLVMASTEHGDTVRQDVSLGVVALATSPVKEALFVLNEKLGTLTLMDLEGEGEQVLVPVGRRPVALTVSSDGERVYVADRGGPAVVVVDVGSARVIASIPLLGEPLSLAVR